MASQKDVDRQKEINKSKESELKLQAELNRAKEQTKALEADALSISSASVDSIKEQLGIKTRISTFDHNLLKVNKQINQQILNQQSGLDSIESLTKQIQKNEDAIIKAKKVQQTLQVKGLGAAKGNLTNISKLQKEQKAITDAAEEGLGFDSARFDKVSDELATREATLDRQTQGMTMSQKQALFTIQNIKALEEQNQKRIEEKEELEKIEKKLGVFGGILKGISKIPIIGDIVDTDKILKAARDKVKETKSGLAGLGAGFVEIGKQVAEAFKPANLAAAAFAAIVTATIKLDKQSGELAKSMNMTVGEARDLTRQFAQLSSNELASSLVSSKGMLETLQAINATLGTNVMLNQTDLVTFTKLREAAGFTNEELMGIQQLTLANGGSLKENTGEFMAQAKVSAMQNGVLLNEKELLKGIGDVSAATTLSFGKNPGLIAQAVSTAKSLGMELDKVDSIADSLLDFESSIENELQAELLLGKDINLEKARQAALNNDLATVAKEISSQIGSSAEFSKMNRIQQEALASSVGMSKEDLAQTLYTQEQLAGATGEEAEKRQAILDKRIAEVGLAQAQEEIAKDGLSTMEDQASVSEKFEKTMTKVLDMFMGIAGIVMEIVTPLVDFLLPVFNSIAAAVKLIFEGLGVVLMLLSPLIAYMGVMYLISKKKAIMDTFSASMETFGPIPVIGYGLAIAAALAGIGLVKRLATADDLLSSPTMKPGYGDRTLMGPEGAIALNNRDTVIAGTNLFPRGDDVTSSPAGSVNVGASSSKETNALLKMLVTQNAKKPQISPVGLYSVQ